MAGRINKSGGLSRQSGIIEPTDDGVLEDLAKKRTRDREEGLMLAVLESATEDYQKYVNARDRKGKLLFSQAEEWFFEKDSDPLFSFEHICEVLRLQPDYVRKGLLRWKEAHRRSSHEGARRR
jgi:hypothetical protein